MNKNTTLTIRINVKTKNELFKIANKKGLKTSKIINDLIYRYIEKNYKLLN